MRSTQLTFLFLSSLSLSATAHAGGRLAIDAATHDKYDAWAEDILIGVPRTSPHYFDLFPTDHREHVVYNVKDFQLRLRKDGVIGYTYHTKSGWYIGGGLSNIRMDVVSQYEVQPTRLLFLSTSNRGKGNGMLFIDSVLLGYEFAQTGARGKAEVCLCNGLIIRWAGQWRLLQRGAWELFWHHRGSVRSTVDLETAVIDVVKQRGVKKDVKPKNPRDPSQTAYKEEIYVGFGLRLQHGGFSFGAEYQFVSTEMLKPGVRTPIAMRQPLPKVVSAASPNIKTNDFSAQSAADAVLPNDLVFELPSAAEDTTATPVKKDLPFKTMYYTPVLPEASEQHRALFDVTYAWDSWRVCAHYQTGDASYSDSVGIRVSYHF